MSGALPRSPKIHRHESRIKLSTKKVNCLGCELHLSKAVIKREHTCRSERGREAGAGRLGMAEKPELEGWGWLRSRSWKAGDG